MYTSFSMKHCFFLVIAFTAFTFALQAGDETHVISEEALHRKIQEWKKPNDQKIESIIKESKLSPESIWRELNWGKRYKYVNYLNYENIRLYEKYKKLTAGAAKEPVTLPNLCEMEKIGQTWTPSNNEIEAIRKKIYPWDTELIKRWDKTDLCNYFDYLHYENLRLQIKCNEKIDKLASQSRWFAFITGVFLGPWIFLILISITIFIFARLKGKRIMPSSIEEDKNLCCPYCGAPYSADEKQCQKCKTWFGPFQGMR